MSQPNKYKQGMAVLSRIISWTAGKSKNKGTLYVQVKFTNHITWTGYLTPKTHENTMKTLERMGFKGANLGMLKNENALDMSKDYSCVIGEVRDYQGKTYYKADWVNLPGGKGFDSDSVDDGIMNELEQIDTRAWIDGAQDIDPPASGEVDTHTTFTADDIPF